ncbi:MAG TPA: hypothetical protein VFT27_12680 [Actinomycetota bacterium]|nr:hypothetical protein [Actinomycetota bacterium]
MGEFSRGGPGPLPNEGLTWVQREHQKEMLEEAEHVHEAKEATASKRRRWWPFGRRRDR